MNPPKSLHLIANELTLVERKLLEPDPDRHQAVNGAIAHLFASGGKRLRPTVALLAFRLLQADPCTCGSCQRCEQGISLAAAVEMLHTATLVHDDIIDGALTRRGAPTLNASWSPGATILTGDYLFARAAELATLTGSVVVMRLFSRALMTICNGELHQLLRERHQLLDRAGYLQRIYAKTGALFVLAAEASGVLAEADSETLEALRVFGRELGIAFQIVDDLLDFVGSESQVGKPLGSDLAQGLVTLPAIYFLETSPDDERILNVVRGRRGREATQAALEAVRNSEAIELSEAEARQHAARAEEALLRLPEGDCRQALLDLADYAVNRQS